MDSVIDSLLVDAGCFERGCACYDPRDAHVQVVEVAKVKEWVGLTEEDLLELYKKFTDSDEWTYEKAIEAKLKEKNAN